MRLASGAQVGPYRIVEQVGQGGMATVYKAYQASLSRFVAVKVLPPHLAADGDFETRFRDEAVRLAGLRHPSIPAVFDYGTSDGVTFIVSDYIDGGTLAQQLGRPLPLDYAVSLLGPVASALDYAHARGVVHRDVKPSNILLTRDGTPMLTDFGIARMLAPDRTVTQTGVILGTPQYMAPEQGAGETSAAGDVYSLGVVAYHMLTGRVPFDAATPMAVILAHQLDPLPLPRSINPALNQEVEAVLLKSLSRDPGARYPTAAALVRALAAAAGEGGGEATPSGPAGPGAKRPTLAWAAAAAVAVVVVISALAFALTRPRAEAAPVKAARVANRVAKWQQWVHMPGVLDIDGPRSDGRMLAVANGSLRLLGRDGSFGAYSPAYKVDPGGEAYIAVSPGVTMAQPSCAFPADDTYALRLQPSLGVTRIDAEGHVTSLTTITGVDGLNGIALDTVGHFGHRLLVTGSRPNVSVVIGVDCNGASTVMLQGPRIEGGLAVAPAGFGEYSGDLVAPDELSGQVYALAPSGARVVALSGLPVGQDIGVESAGFVPPGFMAKGGFAYVADRATAKNAHPGTDSVLRLSSADLAAAGVGDGDLLVVTEGGSLTVAVHCASTCTVLKVATGPDVAHGEGHVAFAINR